MKPVKICGITRKEDALSAAYAGVHAIGFVFFDKSPRHVDPGKASEIANALPPFISTVGLFVNPERGEVESVISEVRLDLLQFHGEEEENFCSMFSVPYIKAARVKPGLDLVQYAACYASARGILLDAFVEGVEGGTGKVFDWSLIPHDLPLPVILSGGLNPENVTDAILKVDPWAVDVSSGVESSKGIKDAGRIAAFMQGVKKADV
ncbi:MAG TPA: phosphoribosylanthranilate isomerase [Burkholderiales bacterium]|nr:phosphoribosylanthranilate isomerase [Burkholderiales bacterium]